MASMTIQTTHTDVIHDTQLDYYSRRLATCSSDRTIKIYEIADGAAPILSAELAGHDGPVWQVGWAHPRFGVLLASCGYDQRVIVHRQVQPSYNQPPQWAPMYAFDGHKSSVNSIDWCPNEYGLILAAASSDGNVSWHQHVDGENWTHSMFEVSRMGCNSVSWAPYNALGSNLGEGRGHAFQLVTGSCDNVVRVWRKDPIAQNFELAQGGEIKCHKDWVRDVAWAPSGSAIPMNLVASCSEDGTVWVHRQNSVGGAWESSMLRDFGKPVWRVSWSVTGNVLAVSTGDSAVTLWKESLDGKWVELSSLHNGGVSAGQADSSGQSNAAPQPGS